ncbi:MAG TPA: hypothetical protein ENI77_08180 [Nitrospirae bacterium]|nr:hypothetical protein [Nitrospirota bacterium]
MKGLKVNRTSVPAMVIGLVVALGLGGYAFIGAGKSKADITAGMSQFYTAWDIGNTIVRADG